MITDLSSEVLNDQEESEDEIIIRAKWIMDGATTLAEAAEKVREFANELDRLASEGYELTQTIQDDYGFLCKSTEKINAK